MKTAAKRLSNLKNTDATKFTSAKQPSGKNKSLGKRKKKFTTQVYKEILSMPYAFTPDSQIKRQLIKAFGNQITGMNIGEVLGLQQIQKAILKGDTPAFNSLMDRAFGKPPQSIDIDANITANSKVTVKIAGNPLSKK